VEFDGKDLADTSRLLSGIMKARGHSPKTMEHGQYMAGTTSSTHIAKCRNRHSGELQRKMANANTCASCVYHHTNADYLKNLRQDLKFLNGKCDASPSLEQERAIIERDNLLQIIALQETRMGFAEKLLNNRMEECSL
jgi:hypothetical protein